MSQPQRDESYGIPPHSQTSTGYGQNPIFGSGISNTGTYGSNSIFNDEPESIQEEANFDSLQLCSETSSFINNDDSRPSQSLPVTPRKIKVSTMLPDVGHNTPDLR